METTEFPDEVPTLPQHSAFGSVWDSQIGVPSERGSGGAGARQEMPPDDELESEPDVPEYVLAERRQQDRRRGGRGGRTGGYRSAIDRERYGVGSRSGFSRGPGRASKGPRPMTPGRASAHAMEPIEQTPGGDPWSEVPPEVQELLRAELARRQTSSGKVPETPRAPESPATSSPGTAPVEEATPKRTVRKRTSRAGSDAASAPEAPEATPKRTVRKRTASTATDAAGSAPVEEAKPKRTVRKRTTSKAAAADEA